MSDSASGKLATSVAGMEEFELTSLAFVAQAASFIDGARYNSSVRNVFRDGDDR